METNLIKIEILIGKDLLKDGLFAINRALDDIPYLLEVFPSPNVCNDLKEVLK